MSGNYDRSARSKEEWLDDGRRESTEDDVTLESTEDDIISKQEPSCDVTLKIFDEPYIPPVHSKFGRSQTSMADDVRNTEAVDYGRQYVSADTFVAESSCLEQSGVAGRSREHVENNIKAELIDDDDEEGSENTRVDASLEAMCLYSGMTHISCEFGGNGDGANNLVAHNVGNEARPFACNMCNYNSSSSYHLKRHKMGHSGEKPFACSYCDYKSHRADKLKRHARTHTGEKPFGCTYCNYKASRADHLKAHVRSHVMKGLGKHFSRICDSK